MAWLLFSLLALYGAAVFLSGLADRHPDYGTLITVTGLFAFFGAMCCAAAALS